MKNPSAKKALNMLVICFFVSIIVGLITGICGSIFNGITTIIFVLVDLVVELGLGIVTIVAYKIGGNDKSIIQYSIHS